jgi:DNA-binding GntR family transcriptional regulator
VVAVGYLRQVDPRRYVQVRDTVLARITSGEYPPGFRLDIGLLASELQVARDTVSHGLTLLEADGRVKRYAGLGWYVE